MASDFSLRRYGIETTEVIRNAPAARLYEDAIRFDKDMIAASGALATASLPKTGRSPKDRRIVEHRDSRGDVWWGSVNIRLSPEAYEANRRRAVDFFRSRERLYVFDGYAGWDERYRIKVRVLAARPYHAIFMHNMLIRPSRGELAEFGEPDYVVFNAGVHPADPRVEGVDSQTSVCISFEHRELVILGTEYAGEMKKGVFTIMNYLMPRQGVLSMHCSANEGQTGDVSLFFGLSGTGKTTLSADPRRKLIGDDEHCWTDEGIFNIEGGCYAKCIGLTPEAEPEIHAAIRFGAVLENVVVDPPTRQVQYADDSITQNTRASYPVEFIPGCKIPCVGGHPRNVIFLTCDAFGVMPPVARLTPSQAMYHFISGYTAKVAGTEVGVTDPEIVFSACFGAAFLVWHPGRYAQMLAERLARHGAAAWLVNTGWSGGRFGVGRRIKLAHTRAIIDAIHDGALAAAPTVEDPVFGLAVPTRCAGVPSELLLPRGTWDDADEYDRTARDLAERFRANFAKFADAAGPEAASGGPR